MYPSDLHVSLQEAIRDRADALNGGVLAVEWVRALSDDEQVAAWKSVLHDSELLVDHRPQENAGGEDRRCVSDGQRFPCAEIARLASTYAAG
jgi:hypothetical protein